jgi:hypothetical protein
MSGKGILSRLKLEGFTQKQARKMSRKALVFALGLHFLLAGISAQACIIPDTNLTVNDIVHADAVLIGRVEGYTILPNLRAKGLHNENDLFATKTRFMPKNTSIFDFAQFDIVVDEVLSGKIGKRLMVIWNVRTFDDPGIMRGEPFLIALMKTEAPNPALERDLGKDLSRRNTRSWTIMQPPCARAFVMPGTKAQMREARALTRGIGRKTNSIGRE